MNPQMNSFLLAPLAKEAGGSGACGKAVFQSPPIPITRPSCARLSRCSRNCATARARTWPAPSRRRWIARAWAACIEL